MSDLEDSQAQLRKCSQRLICRACWRAGQAARITTPEQVGQFPNLKNIALHRPSWNILVCRDVSPPQEVRSRRAFQPPRSERAGTVSLFVMIVLRTILRAGVT